MLGSRFEPIARIAAVALLVLGCFLVLRPFLGAILFAGVLCFSTWPAFVRLRERLNGNSWGAALILVIAMILALAVPVALVAQSIAVYSAGMVETFRGYLDGRVRFQVPAFVAALPLVGPWLDSYIHTLLESGAELAAFLRQFSEPAKAFLTVIGRGIAEGLVQILIAIFVAYFFYRDGERARRLLEEGTARLAGPKHGMALINTAQSAVKGVVYGLIGTAFAQALVALVGFAIAGVPGAFILGALTFILSLIPMGPVLVWGGAATWLYFNGETGWSIFMVVYGVAVISSVDNFVKPILMSRAGNLSMLLVVLGVFGGAIAFGFIGLFVGPALLAVAWNMTKTWLDAPEEPTAQGAA